MTPDNKPMPATLPCGVDEEQLEAYLDGEIAASDRERLDSHVAACEDCAETVRQASWAKQALRKLTEVRCPTHVIAAAEANASEVQVETIARSDRADGRSKRSVVALALAASVALAWFVLPSTTGPSEPVITTTLDAEETKLVLAELREAFRFRAESVKQKVYDRSVAKPVRTVVYAVADSQLGEWGNKAANLFGDSDPGSPPTSPNAI